MIWYTPKCMEETVMAITVTEVKEITVAGDSSVSAGDWF